MGKHTSRSRVAELLSGAAPTATAPQFGDLLRELRKDRGLTQKQLANTAVGVSSSYVALLETGQRRPSIETVAAIATALRCDEREKVALFKARGEGVASSAAPGSLLMAPDDIKGAAAAMTAAAAEFEMLVSRVRVISDDLGVHWAGAAAAAYSERINEWERYTALAGQALRRIAGAIATYTHRVEDISDAVARDLTE